MSNQCKSIGCTAATPKELDFCVDCLAETTITEQDEAFDVPTQLSLIMEAAPLEDVEAQPLSEKYPQYYKGVSELAEIDVYMVHHLFEIKDHSGCIQHASKKLLLSGVRTGGKSAYKDIKEARDTLTRWLQINQGNQ